MKGARGVNRRGFTLVELLVVIGIIAILLSLLLPSLNRAQQESYSVQCQSNMRQIGLAFLIYADEHQGYLFPDHMGWDNQHVYLNSPGDGSLQMGPPVVPAYGNNAFTYNTWPLAVFGVWNPPYLTCPSDFQPVAEHSYIVNEYLAYYNSKYASEKYGASLPAGRTPSDVVLMGEKSSLDGDYYMEYGDYAEGKVDEVRHGLFLGSNYLYLDMHVETQMITSANAEEALDPWDFGNGTTAPTTQAGN